MNHNPENLTLFRQMILSFFQEIRISVQEIQPPLRASDLPDYGLKESFSDKLKDKKLPLPEQSGSEFSVIHLTDWFDCHYYIISCPFYDSLLLVGPFMYSHPDSRDIHELFHLQHLSNEEIRYILNLYHDIPLIQGAIFPEAFIRTAAHILLEASNLKFSLISLRREDPESFSFTNSSNAGSNQYEMIQERYTIEKKMLTAVQHGDYEKALSNYKILERRGLELRSHNSMRDGKNISIVFSTLCRYALTEASVHPYFIDDLSRKLNTKIENAETLHDIEKMPAEILRKYCFLVKNHACSDHSSTIQHAVNYIMIHHDEPISLSRVASALHISQSYLSSSFKRETGQTLTDYCNQIKLQDAIRLMNLKNCSISEIAAQCGFESANYFSRVFRKYKGMSPTEYIKMMNSQ